jgi:aspartate/methionine/tyrosine aminotransferase
MLGHQSTVEIEASGGLVDAGAVSFPRLVRGGVEVFSDLARAHQTAVVPGSFFGAPQHLRIGFGCSTEILRGGLERLGAALDELKGETCSC